MGIQGGPPTFISFCSTSPPFCPREESVLLSVVAACSGAFISLDCWLEQSLRRSKAIHLPATQERSQEAWRVLIEENSIAPETSPLPNVLMEKIMRISEK